MQPRRPLPGAPRRRWPTLPRCWKAGWNRSATGRYNSIADLLDAVLLQSGYLHALRDGTDEGEDRFENLQELRGVLAQYTPGMSDLTETQSPLAKCLEEISLVSDTDDLDNSRGAVTLLTLHMAKGPGISRRLHRRAGGRHPPPQPHAGDRRRTPERRRAGRGAPPLLRGHHPRQAPALPGPLLPPQPLGRQPNPGAQPLPRRNPGKLLTGMVDRQGRRTSSYQRHDRLGRR